MMAIIEIPHPTLRQKAEPISKVDKKLLTFIAELQSTLKATKKPKGAGLAAPQVNKLWRIFATQVKEPRIFINPAIVKHSAEQTLGQDQKEPIMEGCLSIPRLYGPVFRWEWVTLEFDQIKNGKLVRQKEKFVDFPARVVQHELDHLNGILFTDHSLKDNLPVYQEIDPEKFEEVDREFLEMI